MPDYKEKQKNEVKNVNEIHENHVVNNLGGMGYGNTAMRNAFVCDRGDFTEITAEDINASAEKSELTALPAMRAEFKAEIKKTFKDNQHIRNHMAEKSHQELMMWAYGSAEYEGAHADFRQLSRDFYFFEEKFDIYDQTAENKEESKIDMMVSLQTLVKDAIKYIDLYRGKRQLTDKGKNRMALARHIISAEFLGNFIKCNDVEDFFLKNGINMIKSRQQSDEKERRDAFYAAGGTAVEKEISEKLTNNEKIDKDMKFLSLFTKDAEYNKTVITAVKSAIYKGNKMKLYDILEDRINEVMGLKLVPEMFTAKYLRKNPAFVSKVKMLGEFAENFFFGGIYSEKIGAGYIDMLGKTNPQACNLAFRKLRVMPSVAKQLMVNAGVTDEKNDDAETKNMEEFIDDFKLKAGKSQFDESILRCSYSYNRRKNFKRVVYLEAKNISEAKEKFEKAQETNPGVSNGSLEFYEKAAGCDGSKIVDFYLAEGSEYTKMFEKIAKTDMAGDGAKDCIAKMLKAVRFDDNGNPFPEYRENHMWNIRFIDSYKNAAANPHGAAPDYEKCLSDIFSFASEEDNYRNFLKLCRKKDFEKNTEDMEFFVRMIRTVSALSDVNILNSKASANFFRNIDPQKKQLFSAKVKVMMAEARLADLDIKEKYQCSIIDDEIIKEQITKDDPAAYERKAMLEKKRMSAIAELKKTKASLQMSA